jgi:hypothetical protein
MRQNKDLRSLTFDLEQDDDCKCAYQKQRYLTWHLLADRTNQNVFRCFNCDPMARVL